MHACGDNKVTASIMPWLEAMLLYIPVCEEEGTPLVTQGLSEHHTCQRRLFHSLCCRCHSAVCRHVGVQPQQHVRWNSAVKLRWLLDQSRLLLHCCCWGDYSRVWSQGVADGIQPGWLVQLWLFSVSFGQFLHVLTVMSLSSLPKEENT